MNERRADPESAELECQIEAQRVFCLSILADAAGVCNLRLQKKVDQTIVKRYRPDKFRGAKLRKVTLRGSKEDSQLTSEAK